MADQIILITGGSGRLGTILRKLIPGSIAPTHKKMDLTDPKSTFDMLNKHRPDIVIHCAAYTNSLKAETDKDACWNLNVEGTRNILRALKFMNATTRVVYISTDYVFDGTKGNYVEEDTPAPLNYYGLTKLIGEQLVLERPRSLVIRTGFKDDGAWRYPVAFTDQWTSGDPASVRAEQIVRVALRHDILGMLHIGGERRSIYEFAKLLSPEVGKTTRSKFKGVKIPRDVSLNSTKWKNLK